MNKINVYNQFSSKLLLVYFLNDIKEEVNNISTFCDFSNDM